MCVRLNKCRTKFNTRKIAVGFTEVEMGKQPFTLFSILLGIQKVVVHSVVFHSLLGIQLFPFLAWKIIVCVYYLAFVK